MTTVEQNSSRRHRLIRAVMALTAGGLFVLLMAAIAISPVPMRGAEMFGALANKIKGNPGATAVISLSAGAALWLGVALLAAGQEWLAARRRA